MSERIDPLTPWIIRKRFGRWIVWVPADTVATVAFIAPFNSYGQAIAYVRYWIGHA